MLQNLPDIVRRAVQFANVPDIDIKGIEYAILKEHQTECETFRREVIQWVRDVKRRAAMEGVYVPRQQLLMVEGAEVALGRKIRAIHSEFAYRKEQKKADHLAAQAAEKAAQKEAAARARADTKPLRDELNKANVERDMAVAQVHRLNKALSIMITVSQKLVQRIEKTPETERDLQWFATSVEKAGQTMARYKPPITPNAGARDNVTTNQSADSPGQTT